MKGRRSESRNLNHVLENSLKRRKMSGLSEELKIQDVLGRFEVQEELPRSEVFGAQALEKCGVARAVETIQAESSSNAASELSAHQIGSPAGAGGDPEFS